MTSSTHPEMHPSRWGDPAAAAPLPEPTRALVDLAFGTQASPAVEGAVPPPSRLDPAVLAELRGAVGDDAVLTDDDSRRLRTRGKSTPDLLRARAGDLGDAPDAVVRPSDAGQVAAVLDIAVRHHLAVVPFGGGTAVTGGLVARREGFAGVLSLDLGRMARLLAVDPVSMTATLEPGLRGPEAEALLAEHGLTLGHYPQSFEFASIGGFAATRSSGQSSAGYGRFDAMVVGLTAVTPAGPLTLGTAPASAAGPDLRQVLLGSEGAFGVITSVTVRVRRRSRGRRCTTGGGGRRSPPAPPRCAAWPRAAGCRRCCGSPTRRRAPSASPTPTASVPGAAGGCLMIVGHEGDADVVAERRAAVAGVLADLGGVDEGEGPGRDWVAGRFAAPYLRDAMLDVGVLVETLETATFWSRAEQVHADVQAALRAALPGALVLCHISHVYETGCSLYFTVAAEAGDDPLSRWRSAKAAATDAMVAAGATITHHHAVGVDHRPWLEDEIGPLGVRVLRAIKAELDPTGVLNPGVLVP